MASDTEKRITAKMVLDSTGFNSSLQGVNQQLKLSQSELKASGAQVGVFGTQTDKLKVNCEGLSKQIELQKQKVDIYRDSIEKSTQKLQSTIKTRDELKNKLQEETTKYNEVIKLYGKESEESKKAKESIDKLTEEYKKKEKQVESTAKSINNYTVNMNKADAELAKMQGELKKANTELATHENKWIKASESLKNTGEKMNSVGNKLSIGITMPIAGIGVACTKMAMEAVESENLFDVSMGKMKDSARTWSEEVSKSLGLNAYEVRNNVATYNVMLKSMGLTEEEGLKMSESLTQLSYDMASFYNLKPEEAFNKLKSGISGEAEPLKALGILVNDNTIQQYALANGIAKTSVNMAEAQKAAIDVEKAQKDYNEAVKKSGANSLEAREKKAQLALEEQKYEKSLQGSKVQLTEQEKVMARYGVIMQATKDAQGDLGRTMDSPTNKIRIQTEQLKQAGIELGTKLLPLLNKGLDVVKPIVTWLSNLSDSQQEALLKTVAFTAAIGPLLKVGGGAISTVGNIAEGVGKLSKTLGPAAKATEGIKDAANAATGLKGAGGLVGLGTSLGEVAVAAGPWLLAGAAIAGTGYAINKAMSKEAVPSIDLFADKVTTNSQQIMTSSGYMATQVETDTVKISKATKDAVGAYMKLDDDVTKSMLDIQLTSSKITTDTATQLTTKFNDMGNQIKAGMDKKYNDMYTTMQTFFKESGALSDAEEAEALEKLKQNNEFQKSTVDQGTKEIKAILDKASTEKRETTAEERRIIANIKDNMKQDAVKSLSETEIESKVIMERLKGYSERITAEQAADTIKKANETRDKAVAAANDQYDKTVADIIKMRDESHVITADQAEKLLKNAEKQRKDSVDKAEEMRSGVVDKIKKMNPDIDKEVNLQTGTIMDGWGKLAQWWNNLSFNKKKMEVESVTIGNSSFQDYAGSYNSHRMNYTGNDNFEGGFTTLHEKGYELYDLPRGTKIYNHEASEDLVLKTAEKVASKVTGGNSRGINQNIIINSPKSLSPSETARQFKNASRQLALEW